MEVIYPLLIFCICSINRVKTEGDNTMKQKISSKNIAHFAQFLENAEYSPATVSKYLEEENHYPASKFGRK